MLKCLDCNYDCNVSILLLFNFVIMTSLVIIIINTLLLVVNNFQRKLSCKIRLIKSRDVFYEL